MSALAQKSTLTDYMTDEQWERIISLDKIKLAIVGCGAVAEQGHLPAAQRISNIQVTALVDKNLKRASDLAQQFDVPYYADDYHDIFDKVNAVIIALPHNLHAPVGIEFLQRGIHVLCEKPMALTADECDRMNQAAKQSEAILSIGLVRRFYDSSRFVKQIIQNGWFGKIQSFEVEEGSPYNWPTASGFFFRKEVAGGGVLIDTGAHTLDMLLWWLGNHAEVVYWDDAMGGVEANCRLELTLENGVTGTVELSRTRTLTNTYKIIGDKAIIEVSVGCVPHINFTFSGSSMSGDLGKRFNWLSDAGKTLLDYMVEQLSDFSESILLNRKPFISGEEGRRSIALIERCYEVKQQMKLPWVALQNADTPIFLGDT